jgi:hypothetical protein
MTILELHDQFVQELCVSQLKKKDPLPPVKIVTDEEKRYFAQRYNELFGSLDDD